MARKTTAESWLEVVAGLLKSERNAPARRRTRRLMGERLEGRMVLSGAPVDAADGGESLAEYLAHEQEMGPVAPAELAAVNDAEAPPEAVDQYFGIGEPEGEDCGEGGEGCGEGEGSGEGSGGSEEPEISADVGVVNGEIIVSGQVSDDGDLSELSMTLENGVGSVTLNSDGTFTVQISDPQGYEDFTITVTDADGNVTTYTFAYDP